jgi:hypothetical protein
MSLGPLEFLVLTFPGPGLAAGVQVALDRVAKTGDLRIVDALLVRKSAEGAVNGVELVDADELRAVEAAYGLETSGLVSGEDVRETAGLLAPDTTAMVLLVEHVWAKDLANEIEAAGGELLAAVRIRREHTEEAVRSRADVDAAAW